MYFLVGFFVFVVGSGGFGWVFFVLVWFSW